MYVICNESTMYSDDIFYSELYNININDIISDIIFLDNLFGVISNYQ